jgi:hypothetical protein
MFSQGRQNQKSENYFPTIHKNRLLLQTVLNRGALTKRAEIKPIEPDTGNAGEGMDKL